MKGLSQDAARSRVSMFDICGLLEPARAGLSEAQKVASSAFKCTKDSGIFSTPLPPAGLVTAMSTGRHP
jgi:malate dehydrogenase (oxaloacetate-decarboxylating)(NADP+)